MEGVLWLSIGYFLTFRVRIDVAQGFIRLGRIQPCRNQLRDTLFNPANASQGTLWLS
jgi:hypothetical protein